MLELALRPVEPERAGALAPEVGSGDKASVLALEVRAVGVRIAGGAEEAVQARAGAALSPAGEHAAVVADRVATGVVCRDVLARLLLKTPGSPPYHC